jgi:anti-anti-sigma regulatory factor
MTYRIQRVVEADAVVFLLSGELDASHSAKLRALMAAEEPDRVRLDLKEVTVVDRTGLEFLVQVDVAGIPLVNCADYLRRWITVEEASR